MAQHSVMAVDNWCGQSAQPKPQTHTQYNIHLLKFNVWRPQAKRAAENRVPMTARAVSRSSTGGRVAPLIRVWVFAFHMRALSPWSLSAISAARMTLTNDPQWYSAEILFFFCLRVRQECRYFDNGGWRRLGYVFLWIVLSGAWMGLLIHFICMQQTQCGRARIDTQSDIFAPRSLLLVWFYCTQTVEEHERHAK